MATGLSLVTEILKEGIRTIDTLKRIDKQKQIKSLSLMENKLIIDGKEIKLSDETVKEIKEQLLKTATCDDVARELFVGKRAWYLLSDGHIENYYPLECGVLYPNNCTSEKQAQKLLAINKLLNTAKYLNGDWKPEYGKQIWYLSGDINGADVWQNPSLAYKTELTYFKTRKLAEQAIEILGEETIKLALSTDW